MPSTGFTTQSTKAILLGRFKFPIIIRGDDLVFTDIIERLFFIIYEQPPAVLMVCSWPNFQKWLI